MPAPVRVEGLERVPRGLGGLGDIDLAQLGRDRLAILPGAEVQRVANQMNDAGLNRGLREGGGDRLGEPLQPIDDRDQDVLNL